MAKKRAKTSVKFKLISVMMLICIVPITVSLIISYNNSMNQAINDARSLSTRQTTIVEDEFTSILKQNLHVLEAVAENPYTVAFISDTAGHNEEEMKEYLIALNEWMNDPNDIVISDSTGQQIIRTSGDLVNIGDRDYFKECLKGSEYISDVLISKATGSRIVVLAVPVKDKTDQVIGVVQKSYDLSFLHEFLSSSVDSSAGEESFIVGRTGDIIAHSSYEISADEEAENYSSSEFFTSSEEEGNYINTHNSIKLMMAYNKNDLTGWIVVTAVNYNAVTASARHSAFVTIIVGVVMLIAAVIISLNMASSFIKPLNVLTDSIGKLAEGVFSPIDKYTERTDEFGSIINSTNTVINTLNRIITNIKSSTAEVNNSSENLAETANQISDTSESVATAVQEIASGATQQANEIQNVTENVASISDATAKVEKETDELANLANNMQEASNVSAESLDALQKSSQNMSESIAQISAQVGSTGESVDNINSKVEEIASIAAQTNLLSLNASIEAARAGEAGKGFAVVADEISHLADNSRNLANGIRSEMDLLLTKSRVAVEMAGSVQNENNHQQDVINTTVSSVNDILNDINSTVEKIKTIDSEVASCVESNSVVSDAMSSLSAISQENAASSETTGAAVDELSVTVT
ncbi:MAG: methyl-accepting chemotaxis protein, partial [Lachnospiraceae bacterium]|nr:methyl-accepting chemotaxis protein [Lachnospiraceae bacterium]